MRENGATRTYTLANSIMCCKIPPNDAVLKQGTYYCSVPTSIELKISMVLIQLFNLLLYIVICAGYAAKTAKGPSFSGDTIFMPILHCVVKS